MLATKNAQNMRVFVPVPKGVEYTISTANMNGATAQFYYAQSEV